MSKLFTLVLSENYSQEKDIKIKCISDPIKQENGDWIYEIEYVYE